MRAVKLKKEDLSSFLECSQYFGEIWGPQKKGDRYVLEATEDMSKLDFSALRTTLPFKKLLAPPKFSMFKFNKNGYMEQLDQIPSRVIVGLHPCDIHALLIMDEFFAKNHIDPYYMERRRRTAFIGFSCLPDEKCFCYATKTDSVEEGFDLFFTELGEIYLIWVGSSLGDDMVRHCPHIIDEDIGNEDLQKYIQWRKHRSAKFKNDVDLTGMPDIMELSQDSPIWEEEGEKCLSCGACTIVCPTCPCYNVYDEIKMGELEGDRVRKWDSCLFKEYSMVAGNHNFREARAERLRLRFTHKLQAFVGQFGKPACTGCGRCIETCPVDIDIKTVAQRLQLEEVKV